MIILRYLFAFVLFYLLSFAFFGAITSSNVDIYFPYRINSMSLIILILSGTSIIPSLAVYFITKKSWLSMTYSGIPLLIIYLMRNGSKSGDDTIGIIWFMAFFAGSTLTFIAINIIKLLKSRNIYTD